VTALIVTAIAVIIFIFIASGIWYAFKKETINFKLSENTITVRQPEHGRPAPLKILHLSDFHLRPDEKGKKLFEFIKILSLETFDLIFITGDMIEKDEYREMLSRCVKNLSAKNGIYAVYGAHDYYNKKPSEFLKNMFKKKESYSRGNDISALTEKLSETGIKVLQNESIVIENTAGYEKIEIIGLDDPIINKTDLKKAFSSIFKNSADINIINFAKENLKDSFSPDGKAAKRTEAHKKVEAHKKAEAYKKAFTVSRTKIHDIKNPGILRIALVHTPDSHALVNLSLNSVDLIFCGHTHGGQVRIPGYGAIISGANIKTKYASGLFYFKEFVLQISRGLGEGRFSKFRVFCSPEAIITRVVMK